MASEMASELGDRIKQEGDKLRKLELVGHAASAVHKKNKRKAKQKGRSKLGMLTLAVMAGGFIYAVYRMLRIEPVEDMTLAGRAPYTPETAAADRPTVKSA